MREHGSLAEVVKFIRGKMDEKASENAAAMAEQSEEEPDEHESEEGEGPDVDEPSASQSPAKKKKAAPKKKKITSGGMQLPEDWPWEAAKELFIHPDVQKSADLEVSFLDQIVRYELMS